MRVLYIIAWVCLVLSIIVHILSILGPEDIFSDVDAFIWFLHGGGIFLGLPMILCSQKLIVGTKERNFWEAVLKDCPLWMRKMIGFFVFYGIINFILFMIKGVEVTNSNSAPTSVFKGFSGFWMIAYSIEVAVFYSYLKKRSKTLKSSLDEHRMPMKEDFQKQYNLNLPYPQTKQNKYSRFIVIFLVVGSIFMGLLWLAFKGYPWFLGCTLFSLFPFVVINVAYMAYSSWRHDIYLQKNYFKIWKKGKSSSLADRMESQMLIRELDDPYLKSLTLKISRFSKICFWVWFIVIGVILIGLTLMQ